MSSFNLSLAGTIANSSWNNLSTYNQTTRSYESSGDTFSDTSELAKSIGLGDRNSKLDAIKSLTQQDFTDIGNSDSDFALTSSDFGTWLEQHKAQATDPAMLKKLQGAITIMDSPSLLNQMDVNQPPEGTDGKDARFGAANAFAVAQNPMFTQNAFELSPQETIPVPKDNAPITETSPVASTGEADTASLSHTLDLVKQSKPAPVTTSFPGGFATSQIGDKEALDNYVVQLQAAGATDAESITNLKNAQFLQTNFDTLASANAAPYMGGRDFSLDQQDLTITAGRDGNTQSISSNDLETQRLINGVTQMLGNPDNPANSGGIIGMLYQLRQQMGI